MAYPEKQILDLPIVGGLSQKESSLLTQRPLQMTNCTYRKSGAIEKRYGYTDIGPYNLRLDGYTYTTSTPAVTEQLVTLDDELLRIGGGRIDTFRPLNSTTDWVARGRTPEAHVTLERIGTGEALILDPDVATNEAYTVTIHSTYESSSATRLSKVCVNVIDNSNNSRLISNHVLSTASFTAPDWQKTQRTKTLIIGNFAYFFYQQIHNVRYAMLNLTTMQFTSPQILLSAAAWSYDVAHNSTHLFMVFEDSTGVMVHKFNIHPTSGLLNFLDSVLAQNDMDLDCVGIYATSSKVYLAWAHNNAPGSYRIRCKALNTDLTTAASSVTLDTQSTSDDVYNISICPSPNSRSLVVWSRACAEAETPHRIVHWQEVDDSMSEYYSTPRVCNQTFAVSKPFLHGTSNYIMVMNMHSTHGTFFMVDLGTGTLTPTTETFRMVAVTAPRQVSSRQDNGLYTTIAALANVAAFDANTFKWVGITLGETIAGADCVTLFNISFDGSKRTSCQAANELALASGIPSVYDRNKVIEFGFAHEPDIDLITDITLTTGGSLTPSKTYNYKFLYEWFDAAGRLYQSAPSLNLTVTTGASDTKVSMKLPCLNLTNKYNLSSNSYDEKIQFGIYRTAADGSIYYRVPIPFPLSTVNGDNVFFEDGYGDTTIQSNEKLYTEGGVLDNVIPPSATLSHVFKNSVILAGTDDDSIWLSKEIVPGEAISFNDTIIIPPFEGGRVTGLASIDSTLIIFKKQGIWLIQGDPPNNLGQSTLTSPQRLQTEVGCTDPKSIVSGPDGVFFHAGKPGIHMLTRDFQVVPVGKNVEDSISENASFAGAVLLPNQSLVRFAQYNTTSNQFINYDFYHSRALQTPVWSIDSPSDPNSTGYGQVVACTMWKNNFVWISSTGILSQETTSSFLDRHHNAYYWVESTFETAFEKVTGLNGFHTIWRVNVLGEKTTNHGLSVVLTSDLGTQTKSWTYSEINALKSISTVERLQVHSQYQKVSWMKIKLVDVDPGTAYRSTGKGMTLKGITLEIGLRAGTTRLPSTNRK